MGAVLSHKDSAHYRAETFRLRIKGYNGATITRIFEKERLEQGLKPINKGTVSKWIRDMDRVGSKDYLYLMKDKSAYMFLHRRKLLALELYRTMIHDKIDLLGGLGGIKPEALNRFIQSLIQITIAESRLEREIPSLFSDSQPTMSADQYQDLEAEILSGLPKDLRDQFTKEQARRRRLVEQVVGDKGKASTEDIIDLDSYPKDTHII